MYARVSKMWACSGTWCSRQLLSFCPLNFLLAFACLLLCGPGPSGPGELCWTVCTKKLMKTLSRSNRSGPVRHSRSLRASTWDFLSFQSSSARLFDLLVTELLASRSLHTISFCGSMSSIWITSPNITESKFELGLSSRTPSNELNRHEPSARPTFIATQSILYSSRCIHPWHVGRNSKFCLHGSTDHVSITVTFFRCCRHVVLWKLVVQIWRIPQYVRTFYWSWRGARWSSCILMDLTELSWRARADRHHLTTWLFRGCPKVPQVILFWRLSNSVNWMSQISIRIPNESHPTGKTVTCNVRWRRFYSYFKIEISLKETSCRRTLFKEKWRLSALSEFSTSMIEVVLTTSSPTLVRTSPLPNATVLHPWARSSAAKPVPFRFSRREEIDIDLTFSNEFPALGREN